MPKFTSVTYKLGTYAGLQFLIQKPGFEFLCNYSRSSQCQYLQWGEKESDLTMGSHQFCPSEQQPLHHWAHLLLLHWLQQVLRHLFLLASSWMSQFGPEPHPSLWSVFQDFPTPRGKKINLSQRKFIPSKIHVEELRYTVFQECLPCSQHHQAEFIVLLWTRPTKGGSSHFKNRWCSHWNLDELINLTTWTLWKGWSTV